MAHNIFQEHEYRDALQRHYGRLLQLSSRAAGKPNSKELALLDKIEALERDVEKQRASLTAPEWDAIHNPVTSYAADNDDRSAKERDKDVQVSIYGLETSLQSIQTMDACFGQVLDGASRELGDVETHFLMHVQKSYMRPKSSGPPGSGSSLTSGRSGPPGRTQLPLASRAQRSLREREALGATGDAWAGTGKGPGQDAQAEFWGSPIHFTPQHKRGPAAAEGLRRRRTFRSRRSR